MALVIPTGFAQVVINFRHASTPREMSTTFGVDFDNSETDPELITNRVAFAINEGTIESAMDSSLTITTIGVIANFGGTDPVIYEKSYNIVGDTNYETPPLSVALLVRKNSALGGRANRGRMYWPGLVSEAQVNEVGQLTAQHLSDCQAVFNNFFGQLDDLADEDEAALTMVILHDESSPATVPTVVTSLTVDGLVASQRRRVRG